MTTPMAKKLAATCLATVALSLVGVTAPASAAKASPDSVSQKIVKNRFDTGWNIP